MRKLTLTLSLLLTLLLSAAVRAEGILPVLQTPAPELTETISYHRAMNYSSTPSASSTSDGCYYYEYSSIPYASYLDFGRALAQEGYVFSNSIDADDGTGGITVETTKDTTVLTIYYNDDRQYLKVTYSPRVLAEEVNPEDPYVIDKTVESILPELKQVVSLHAITGLDRRDPEQNYETGGYRYHYYDVPYTAYERFSVKLAEDGFSLVSSEKTEDGYDRAVVSDGETELTIDYHQENKDAYVSYPQFAHARDRDRFGDYETVHDGDTVSVTENIKITFTGWEKVDRYYASGTYLSEEGIQLVLIHMDVDFYRPESWDVSYLLKNRGVYIAGNPVSDIMNYGIYYYDEEDPDQHNITSGSYTGRAQFSIAMGLRLTEEQAAHPEDVAISFFSVDYTTPYVYYLQAPEM